MDKDTKKAMDLLKEVVGLNIDTIEGLKKIAYKFQKEAKTMSLNEYAIKAYEELKKAADQLNYRVYKIVDAIEYEENVLLPQEAEEEKKYGKH